MTSTVSLTSADFESEIDARGLLNLQFDPARFATLKPGFSALTSYMPGLRAGIV